MENEIDTLLLLRSRSYTIAQSHFVSSRGRSFLVKYVIVLPDVCLVAVAVFQSNSLRDM